MKSSYSLGIALLPGAQNLLTAMSFYFLGSTIAQLTQSAAESGPGHRWAISAASYIALKLLAMLSDILASALREKAAHAGWEQGWHALFPNRLHRDDVERSQDWVNALLQDLSRLHDLKAQLLSQLGSAASLIMITLGFSITLSTPVPVLAALAAALPSWLGALRWVPRLEEFRKALQAERDRFTARLCEMIRGHREIRSSWARTFQRSGVQGFSHSQWTAGWMAEWIAEGYATARKSYLSELLRRDLGTQLFLEIPHLLITIALLVLLWREALSVAGFFSVIGISGQWVGLGQSLRAIAAAKSEIRTLERSISRFESKDQSKDQAPTAGPTPSICVKLRLQDLQEVNLTSTPGLKLLIGKNGSGKSTLLDLVGGYFRNDLLNESECLSALNQISPEMIRVITPHAYVDPYCRDMNELVFGPGSGVSAGHPEFKMPEVLEHDLREQWQKAFQILKERIEERPQLTLSSGESVLISMLRALASWDDRVRFILADEVDSCLDPQSCQLVLRTLRQLSNACKALVVTHQPALWDVEVTQDLVALVGPDEGRVISMKLRARPAEELRIRGQDPLSEALEPLLKKAFLRLAAKTERKERDGNGFPKYEIEIRTGIENVRVEQVESAGLGLSIAAMNLLRELDGKRSLEGLTGTGILRFDGSFENARGEAPKRLAVASRRGSETRFLTASEVPDLDALLKLDRVSLS